MNYEEQLYLIYLNEQEYLKRILPFDEYLSYRDEVFRTKKSAMYDPVLSKVIELIKNLQRVVRSNNHELAEDHLKELRDYCTYQKFCCDDNKNSYGCYMRCPKLFLWLDDYLGERCMEDKN